MVNYEALYKGMQKAISHAFSLNDHFLSNFEKSVVIVI